MTAVEVKVPFTAANVNKCMCPGCPVQTQSSCVLGKIPKIRESLKSKVLNTA